MRTKMRLLSLGTAMPRTFLSLGMFQLIERKGNWPESSAVYPGRGRGGEEEEEEEKTDFITTSNDLWLLRTLRSLSPDFTQ